MAKQGEIDYLMRIGEAGARHAAGKPYSDVGCGSYLMQIGCIMSLLPQPPFTAVYPRDTYPANSRAVASRFSDCASSVPALAWTFPRT